jgi:hypothetical protein
MVDGNAGPSQDQRGLQVVTSNRNATDLFACKWLRAPATTDDQGLRMQQPLTPFVYPDFTQETGRWAGCASNGWSQRCGRTRLPRLRAPAVYRLRVRATRPLLLQGPGLLPELRWTAHDGVAPPASSRRCRRGPRAPAGAESSVASSLSAGGGPRAGARGARRVRAGAAGFPAPPRAPVRARPISWMPAGAESRRLSRAATRSDPT